MFQLFWWFFLTTFLYTFFFIYPTIEYFLQLVRLCFPQNFWTNQHFFIGFFYLKSRSNMPENKGLPIFSTPSSLSFLPNTPTQKNNGRDRSASCYKPWATLGPAVIVFYRVKVNPRRVVKFFSSINRVENQKLNQTTAKLPFGWVFGFQLGLRQTQ